MKLKQLALFRVVLLMGCARNEIQLTNQGSKCWQDLEIKSGRQVFSVHELQEAASQTFRFQSQVEDGGQVTGKLEGQTYQADFGYFTPNLATQYVIISRTTVPSRLWRVL